MTDSLKEIFNTLHKLEPHQRLKLIRKKVLKKNQMDFCKDGIIRPGTLKAIEAEVLPISDKNKTKLQHKFTIEGLEFSDNILDKNTSEIFLNTKKIKKSPFGSQDVDILERLREFTFNSIPYYTKGKEFEPMFPSNTLFLLKKLEIGEHKSLKNNLCLLQGTQKNEIYYLTFDTEKIYASKAPIVDQSNTEILPPVVIEFCTIFLIKAIYYD